MARYACVAPKGSPLPRAIVKCSLRPRWEQRGTAGADPARAGNEALPQYGGRHKTVTCNLDCNINNHNTNPDSQTCPHACICTLTDAPTEDLSASMLSEVFAKLAGEVAAVNCPSAERPPARPHAPAARVASRTPKWRRRPLWVLCEDLGVQRTVPRVLGMPWPTGPQH